MEVAELFIECIPLGPVEANCYIVSTGKGSKGFIIDPGSLDIGLVQQVIDREQLNITHILLTHGHFDHILGVDELRKITGAMVCIHEKDQNKLVDAKDNLSTYMGAGYSFTAADKLLVDGDIIEIGEMNVKVIHTPGHTPGGVCYYLDNCLFSGDTLFAGSIGRTDFPAGSMRDLLASIKEKLLILPPDTIVYPGHNQQTTIQEEKNHNPYLAMDRV